MINWWNVDLTTLEININDDCFKGQHLSYGSIGKEFESQLKELFNVNDAILCTSGSVALLMAIKGLKLPQNSEIILPDVTFQATYNAIIMAGARPILSPVNDKTGLIDLAAVEKLINKNTKAIIAVHLNGRTVDIQKLKEITSAYNIRIIEDCAQSFMIKDKNNNFVGTQGDIGCFSLGVTKFLTSGQGGFILVNDSNLISSIRDYLFHGQVNREANFPIYKQHGFNFRLADILSNIALKQLNQINTIKNSFINTYQQYKYNLDHDDITLVNYPDLEYSFPIWIEIALSQNLEKATLIDYLKEKQIATYPIHTPIHYSINQKHFSQSMQKKSNHFWNKRLVIPSGPHISSKNIINVCDIINKIK